MNNEVLKADRVFSSMLKSSGNKSPLMVINDKNVCYVGSAPFDIKAAELAQYDYVILSNPTERFIRQLDIGLENVIIFLNSNYARSNVSLVKKLRAQALQVVFKESASDCGTPEAGAFLITDYGAFGAVNALLSIMLAYPKSTTIFGVNGYSSISPFNKALKNYTPNKQHISNILRRHDAIVNHVLISYLGWKLSIMSSTEFYNFYRLTIYDYCKLVDQQYGDIPAKRIDGFGF